jgi:hypothetical protein
MAPAPRTPGIDAWLCPAGGDPAVSTPSQNAMLHLAVSKSALPGPAAHATQHQHQYQQRHPDGCSDTEYLGTQGTPGALRALQSTRSSFGRPAGRASHSAAPNGMCIGERRGAM